MLHLHLQHDVSRSPQPCTSRSKLHTDVQNVVLALKMLHLWAMHFGNAARAQHKTRA